MPTTTPARTEDTVEVDALPSEHELAIEVELEWEGGTELVTAEAQPSVPSRIGISKGVGQ